MTDLPPGIDLGHLHTLLIEAEVPGINGLTGGNDQAFTFDQDGNQVDLPPEADPVIAAYTPPLDYGERIVIPERILRTVDATAVELFRMPLDPMTGYVLRLSLLAMADNNQMRMIEGVMVVGRANQNALIVSNADGAQQTIQADHRLGAGASSWNINPGVEGPDFFVMVTGAAGRTIDWRFAGTWERFKPAGDPILPPTPPGG